MRLQRLLALYRRHFRDPRRERMFIASLGFFVTFALTRLTTHHLRDNANAAGTPSNSTRMVDMPVANTEFSIAGPMP